MDLVSHFQAYVKKENLFQKNDRLLVGVSGGVDSIVLCNLCKVCGYDFAMAHCNFQLRNSESEADEIFVRSLVEKYQVNIFVNRFETSTYAAQHKVSVQVAARELRYAWFAELVNGGAGPTFTRLLTAHHANDNIETLLMNFFKGTGLAGLQGILPLSGTSPVIARPLLFARKENLQLYAKQNGLQFREDASNSSNQYTRNYFRNELIPSIQKVYPAVEENLLDNLDRFKEMHLIYSNAVAVEKNKLIVKSGNEIHVPVLKLSQAPALRSIIYELTREYGFTTGQIQSVISLLKSDSGKYIDSATHRILRNRKWLLISEIAAPDTDHFIIEKVNSSIIFSEHNLSVEEMKLPEKIDPASNLAFLDARQITFPLLLRKWKQGDYFYPLGMKKKKKLSRFFIDKKLSLNEKKNTWVVEMDKKIIWIVGQRIDERFKVLPNSTTVLKLSITTK